MINQYKDQQHWIIVNKQLSKEKLKVKTLTVHLEVPCHSARTQHRQHHGDHQIPTKPNYKMSNANLHNTQTKRNKINVPQRQIRFS